MKFSKLFANFPGNYPLSPPLLPSTLHKLLGQTLRNFFYFLITGDLRAALITPLPCFKVLSGSPMPRG